MTAAAKKTRRQDRPQNCGWLTISCLLSQSQAREEEDQDTDGATYQLDMMRCLREVNVDNNTVGWSASAFCKHWSDSHCHNGP